MPSFVGRVVKQKFAKGSKSQHQAVILKTDDGDFKLRLVDGNPFDDPRLNDLIGKTIRCTGQIDEYNLTISQWQEVESGGKRT
jgi:hypothetical protein